MPKLVIFDFDDTLVHLEVDWKGVAEKLSKLTPSSDKGDWVVSKANALIKEGKRKEAFAIVDKAEEDCIARKAYVPFPNMLALIPQLYLAGYKIAIASSNSSKTIKKILEFEKCAQYISFVYGREETELLKPHPHQLNAILQKTKTNKQDVLFIGDSENDTGAGKAAGIETVQIRPNNEQDAKRIGLRLLAQKKKYTYLLSLGSNLGNKRLNISKAIETLKQFLIVSKTSSFYKTAPMYNTKQPAFYNLCIEGYGYMEPKELIEKCLDIENSLKRTRDPNDRFGPRTIDIDIVAAYDSNEKEILQNSPSLVLPHPRFSERGFVLVPLQEITKRTIRNKSLDEYVTKENQKGIERLRGAPKL